MTRRPALQPSNSTGCLLATPSLFPALPFLIRIYHPHFHTLYKMTACSARCHPSLTLSRAIASRRSNDIKSDPATPVSLRGIARDCCGLRGKRTTCKTKEVRPLCVRATSLSRKTKSKTPKCPFLPSGLERWHESVVLSGITIAVLVHSCWTWAHPPHCPWCRHGLPEYIPGDWNGQVDPTVPTPRPKFAIRTTFPCTAVIHASLAHSSFRKCQLLAWTHRRDESRRPQRSFCPRGGSRGSRTRGR